MKKKYLFISVCCICCLTLFIYSVLSLASYDAYETFSLAKNVSEATELSGVWYDNEIPKNLIAEIDKAQESILFFMFKFDSKAVADALIRASNRCVRVSVLLDDRSSLYKIEENTQGG